VCAVLAAHDVAAEGRGAAALDRRHDLQLLKAHVTGVGLAPRRSVLAEDVRDLQRWTRHRRRGSGGRLTTPLGLVPGCGPLRRFGWSLALCLSGWLGLSTGEGFLRRLVDLGVVSKVSRPRDQILEWAGDLLNSLGGHPGVDGSCVQFGMTEQS